MDGNALDTIRSLHDRTHSGNSKTYTSTLRNRLEPMSREQQIAIKSACIDLIKSAEARNRNEIEQHDWNTHIMSIIELIKVFPFLNEYKCQITKLI
jgi:hypothetical protein